MVLCVFSFFFSCVWGAPTLCAWFSGRAYTRAHLRVGIVARPLWHTLCGMHMTSCGSERWDLPHTETLFACCHRMQGSTPKPRPHPHIGDSRPAGLCREQCRAPHGVGGQLPSCKRLWSRLLSVAVRWFTLLPYAHTVLWLSFVVAVSPSCFGSLHHTHCAYVHTGNCHRATVIAHACRREGCVTFWRPGIHVSLEGQGGWQ